MLGARRIGWVLVASLVTACGGRVGRAAGDGSGEALTGGAGGAVESSGAAGAGGGDTPRAVAVTVGNYHSCALTSDQRVLCWGGVGENAPPFGLAEVPPGRYTAVDAGVMHTCAVRVDATVVCWGDDQTGAVGPIPSGQYTDVASGVSESCALHLDGSIECWPDFSSPEPALLPAGRYVELEVEGPGLAAVHEDGSAYCTSSADRYPVDLIGSYSHPAEWNDAFCAISGSGDVDCIAWDGTPFGDSGLPSGARHIALSAAGDQLCGVQESGAAQCTGSPAPEQAYVDIAVGYYHHCAMRDDGGVDCWPNPDSSFTDVGQLDVPTELR